MLTIVLAGFRRDNLAGIEAQYLCYFAWEKTDFIVGSV